MRTICGLVLTSVALLFALAASGQPGEVPRLGVLVSGSASHPNELLTAFREGLKDLGHIEDRNIRIEYRFSEGVPGRLPGLARDIMKSKPDILFAAGGNDIARALKDVAGNIPIVMAGGSDPVGSGLVASLSRPGGNVTGLTSMSASLTGKRLELIRELVPGSHPIAVMYNPRSRQKQAEAEELSQAARALGIEMRVAEVRTADDIARAVAQSAGSRAAAMTVLSDTFTRTHGRAIGAQAIRFGLPTIFADRQRMLDSGGLISYGPDYAEMWRRAAGYVDRILKGAKASDLPVEQPSKFELVVNLKTAKALGIRLPPSIMLRADELIR